MAPIIQRNNDDIRQTTKNSPYQLWVIPALPSPTTSESIAVRPLQSLSSFVAQVFGAKKGTKNERTAYTFAHIFIRHGTCSLCGRCTCSR